jgi:alpha-L-rhamnosidase
MTLFARFCLRDGKTLRITSEHGVKTGIVAATDWSALGYDDSEWDVAQNVLAPTDGYHPWPASPAMYLRHEFLFEKPLAMARLYATALGAYEARINGHRVGDAWLTPEISQYSKSVLYRVYDVTELLTAGVNAIGLLVGDGYFASYDGRFAWEPPPRRVLAQLELTFVDGSREVVATDPGWRIAQSPIRKSEMRIGEVYDARLEQSGWDRAGFDDSHWPVAELAETPACRLVAHASPPIRIKEVLRAVRITEPREGVYVFDFGRHFAGWCRLHVKGMSGSKVELRFAELVKPSGEIDQNGWNIGDPKQDVFILKGALGTETFEPHFTYRGFRYVEVTGLPSAPHVGLLEGCLIHSDLDVTASFRSDSSQIEQIWDATLRTQQANFVGFPTDCPSREQRGFMADVGIFWDAAAFNMDVCAFTRRQMENVLESQSPDGAFPICAPLSRWLAGWLPSGSTPAWSDGSVIAPWIAWKRYGDLDVVERCWAAMNRYLQFILDRNPNYIWTNGCANGFGDWLSVGQTHWDPSIGSLTPIDLISTAYWARSAALLAEMSQALGRHADAERLRALFERVRRAFNDRFVRPDGLVGSGSQTSYILALKFELLPENLRSVAVVRLVADIHDHGTSLTTGILGTQFALDVLADAGHADVAYSLLLRTEYPSWGYMLRNGATTIWENWSGELQDAGRISRNHFALGAVSGFLFRRVAGIDAALPGFAAIAIRPVLDHRIKRVGAQYDSVMGRISTDWMIHSDGTFQLDVVVPANTTACVYLPAPPGGRIEEGGVNVANHGDLRLIGWRDHEALIEVGSGKYRFVVAGPEHWANRERAGSLRAPSISA